MPLEPVHPADWALSPAAARALQTELAPEVETSDRLGPLELVAGIDIGFEDAGQITRAAVAVLRMADLALLEEVVAKCPTGFPYVPGLLSFREIPAALVALARMAHTPDLLVCDGQGQAHPRRFGLASHLGWLLDVPTIGVAKSRLTGTHEEVPPERGAWVPLRDQDETVGAVLRTRTGVKPVYVSCGHRVGLPRAVKLALALTPRFRLAEPIRHAHRLASRVTPAGRTRGRR